MLRFHKSIFDVDTTLTTDLSGRGGGRDGREGDLEVAGPVEKRDIAKQRFQKSVNF
jgi:hypothetical protein